MHAAQLTATYEEHISGRNVTGRDGTSPALFGAHLGSNIALIRRKVFSGTYAFSAYRSHLLSKGQGKSPRVLSIPTVRDRLLLKALSRTLLHAFPGARTPIAPSLIAQLVQELGVGTFDSFVRVDIRNFYPSIRHRELEVSLRKRIRSSRVVGLAMAAIRTPTLAAYQSRAKAWPSVGVPQGLSISNALAEVAMESIDASFSSDPRLRYFRFVDDILILCDSSTVDQMKTEIAAATSAQGLAIHDFGSDSKSASGKLSDRFDYLGYQFEWPRITVRGESITKLQRSLTKVMTNYVRYVERRPKDKARAARALQRCQLRLDLKISGCVYEGARRGWLSFYSQIRHQQLLRHLDWYVAKELGRYGLTGLISPKLFTDSYRFAARGAMDLSGFVPIFDGLSKDEQIDVLARYFLIDRASLAHRDSGTVDTLFRKRMHNLVVDLERDASATY